LVRSSADANETEVARSATCREGNLNPSWKEHFVFQRCQDVILKFQVFAEHYWRKDCFCGEAEIDLTSLFLQIQLGMHNSSNPCEVQLWKKDQLTGNLRLTFSFNDEGTESQGIFPSGYKLRALFMEPTEQTETLCAWFKLNAQPIGHGGAYVARPSDMAHVAELLAAKLEVLPIDFSTVNRMFSKFQVNDEPLLYIDEAVAMIQELMRMYQTIVSSPTHPPDSSAPSMPGEKGTHDFKDLASAVLVDVKKHAAWLTGKDGIRDLKTVAGALLHDGKKHAKQAKRLMGR